MGPTTRRTRSRTGPYQISEYEADKITKLARNPNWDKNTDPLRKALPDEVVVTDGDLPE